MRINKAISSAQSLGVFDVNDESKVRFIVEGAGPSNVIEIRARLLGQPNFIALDTVNGSENKVINVFTYEELQVECTTFDATGSEIKIYAASFSEAGGSAIDSIGVPSGSNLTDFTSFSFDSSDNSVTITGNNSTKTIDLVANVSTAGYTPDTPADWSPAPTTVSEGLDQLAERMVDVETNKIDSTEKGAANGVAPLNALSKIDSTYLPSYVDDVEEYANLASFPPTGEASKIYVALDTNKTYRWATTVYVEISPSAVTSVNGQTGIVTLTKSDVGLGNVDNTSDLNKPISNATQTALNAKVAKAGDTMTGPLNMSALSENIQFSVYGLNASQGIEIKSDDDATRPTGNITIKTGNASGSDATGAIYLQGGTNVDGTPGNILLTAGQSSGIGSDGVIVLNAKGVVYLNDNAAGSIDAGSHRIQNVDDPIADQDAATRKWVDDMSAIDNVLFVSPSANLFIADGSLNRPYATIAAALAVAVDNNVIALLPGTYNEPTVVIPSSLSFIVIQGIASSSTVVTNGISYTSGANSIDLLIQKVNIGTLTLDVSAALNGLVTLKQVITAYDRQDTNSNVFMITTESTCFGGTIAGGGNNFSECLMVVGLDLNGGLTIFENTKFVSRMEAYGTALVRILDGELFGATEFVNGNTVGLDDPTIEIDVASDALGPITGYLTKILLANIPLANLTQSAAITGQLIKWNGSQWVPGTTDASNVSYTEATPADWSSPPNEVDVALDELASRTKILEGDSGTIADILTDTNEPTGFVDRAESTISFNDTFRKFSISPVVTEFSFYIEGNKYTKTTTEELVIPDLTGNHYIYYDTNGDLASTMVFSASIIQLYAFVAVVYWNSSTSSHTYFAEERHGITMDGVTHSYLHTVFGARYLSGLALQGFSVDGSGSLASDAQFTADTGSLRDEDILHILPAQSQIPILYREGTSWKKKAADSFPVIYSGTAGYTGANGRLPYNQFIAGNWQLTEVSNSSYVLVHFFGTNDIDNPIVGIQGIAEYNSIASARLSANSEIVSLAGLPFAEFVAVGSVIFETATSYSNTPKARVISTDTGADYVDFRGTQLYVPAGEASTHGLLSGLANDDHPQYHTDARGDIRYYTKTQIDADVIKKAGTTAFTGNQSMGGNKLTNLANPVALTDAVNLQTLNAALGSSGDIFEKSFSLVNSQSPAANITDFVFANGVVRSFEAFVSVAITATSNLYETFEVRGIQKDSDWFISISSEGDNSGVILSITSAGQMQYITPNYAGFVSGVLKFRAITTSV
jgi:hypothetical protein